ncbi:MAG: peptide deformylase [Peptostreptococcaceae bacterium]|nr:peptide deformylase [Peptostreptococcaceae bacterium]
MAIRIIRHEGDEVLRKIAKPVTKIDDRTRELIADMIETMNDADGVGLAAPQVGILKRIFVIDVGEGPIVMINPQILETSGLQIGDEGCLSIPDYFAKVERPNYVKVKYQDLDMQENIMEGEELFARAVLHENDHLNGILFIDHIDEKRSGIEAKKFNKTNGPLVESLGI